MRRLPFGSAISSVPRPAGMADAVDVAGRSTAVLQEAARNPIAALVGVPFERRSDAAGAAPPFGRGDDDLEMCLTPSRRLTASLAGPDRDVRPSIVSPNAPGDRTGAAKQMLPPFPT